MSHTLNIPVPDENYQQMLRAAMASGQSLDEWARRQLCLAAPSNAQRRAALESLLAVTGKTEHADGASDNESIDRDLAREYGNTHEDEAA